MKWQPISGSFTRVQRAETILYFRFLVRILWLHSLASPVAMPLPRRDKTAEAAKRTIREAFEDLERVVSPTDSHDFGSATLESVRQAALDIENQLGSRSSLRNMRRLEPFFTGLQHYSATIEVLCNGTPYLPWIWAPIKLILKVSRGCCGVLQLMLGANQAQYTF